MRHAVLSCLAALLVAACGGGGGAPPPPGPAVDPLAALSEEFDDPSTLSAWQRLFVTEGWGFDQLEIHDIGATRAGWMTLVPYSSSWYQEWRGVLVHKLVSGDFIASMHIEVANRAGDAAPGSLYSLGGLFVRAPRAITPATWTTGGENYVFLSIGAANTPGAWQSEVKTTVDSDSILEIDAGASSADLRCARIGSVMLLLRRLGAGAWTVHRRYVRTDFPPTLQVGITTYTDWATCEAAGYPTHNTTLLVGGNPDLRAQVDYMRFATPEVPASLVGRDLANGADVSDGELLAWLAP